MALPERVAGSSAARSRSRLASHTTAHRSVLHHRSGSAVPPQEARPSGSRCAGAAGSGATIVAPPVVVQRAGYRRPAEMVSLDRVPTDAFACSHLVGGATFRRSSLFGMSMRLFRMTRTTLVLAMGASAVSFVAAPSAPASSTQLAMLQDDLGAYSHPDRTLQTLRKLGVGAVRVSVRWGEVAPSSASGSRPRGFSAGDPADYPTGSWSRYDAIVTAAQANGIVVDFVVSGPAPLWAVGAGAPRQGGPYRQWRPSSRDYGQFVKAVGTRYSGRYRPAAAVSPLPRVRLWEIWNEPNFGQDLAPQATHDSTRSASPAMYRALLRTAWRALGTSGHARDTILIGGLSARGFQAHANGKWPRGLPGFFSTTKPLRFIRALYCVDRSYRKLRGRLAAAVGCPIYKAGSRRFRASNPGLFGASGFAIHPYPFNLPPTTADARDPDYAEFSEIPRLARTLDHAQRAYGSFRRLPIYNTEYGYITNPPKRGTDFVSPATAARYINWAEYLSWRNPRLATTMQFLLVDPNPRAGVPEYGGFASGLLFFNHKPKATYYAYRMPIYLPVTSTARGRRLTVWGCVRPAHHVALDTHGAVQWVHIQFRRGRLGPFTTIKRVRVRNARGYFEAKVGFPGSGAVRLAWSYPGGQTITSRIVSVHVG
jgi:hypothetical protein